MSVTIRVGQGFDIHRLIEGQPLILGGINIPFPKGLLGHSDGDVVLHAVSDAILGALGAGDIGQHFPDTDPRLKDANSAKLLEEIVRLLRERGYEVVNLDLTIHAEQPKLAPFTSDIERMLAELVEAPADRVNFKAKTNEGLDAIGRGEAIAASAIVLIDKRR